MSTTVEFANVTVQTSDAVAIIRLNDPKTLNAISPRMMDGLSQALAHAENSACRCAILTGEGRGFCSGANLTTTGADDILKQTDLGRALNECYHPVLRRMRDFKLPLIVAVNGPALGFGFSLALMGDLVLAARSAFFQLSFARIGLVPDGGAAWLLARIVGVARMKELVFLADRLPAETAHQWGLVNQLHDDDKLIDAAKTLANDIATRPSGTVPLLRRVCWGALDNNYEQQLALEAELQTRAGEIGDFVEGVTAFREKRLPVFTRR